MKARLINKRIIVPMRYWHSKGNEYLWKYHLKHGAFIWDIDYWDDSGYSLEELQNNFKEINEVQAKRMFPNAFKT